MKQEIEKIEQTFVDSIKASKYLTQDQINEVIIAFKDVINKVLLEKIDRIPNNPIKFPFEFPIDTIIYDNCSKCGLDLKGPMGYVCGNLECPCGLGPTICKVNN